MTYPTPKLDGTQAMAGLAARMKALRIAPNDMRPALLWWADYYNKELDNLFTRGGRKGVVWAKLRRSSRVPFSTSTRMRKSIKRSYSGQGYGRVEFRPDDSFGGRLVRIHGKGASLPARTIYPRKAQALRFVINGKVVFARKASIPASKIPARPILFLTKQDTAQAKKLMQQRIKWLLARRKK